MSMVELKEYGIDGPEILRNPAVGRLYEEAVQRDAGAAISSTGSLMSYSGEKTGRSPKDKRIVREASTEEDVWWGKVNMPISSEGFATNHRRAVEYLNGKDRLYVIDGFAGWDKEHQIKVRIICARAYHALFMHNMLIRPTNEELESFGEPDYVVFNAGGCEADPSVEGVTSKTSVNLDFSSGHFVILGTDYAGEMKKGIFTVMHYLMPKKGVLSMHCSANEGVDGDVTLFFGLSGTGKTTLSTDSNRKLIGDDEHCWTDSGVFNIEGGCYAKAINLSREAEPIIFDAIRFGSVLENVEYDEKTREVDYTSDKYTQNTRTSYPIEFVPDAKVPCVGGHPKNIVFLTCDAYGVLPPLSQLTPEQAMYHFINGYTAKVAGTEMGIDEPEATFSACFGAAFLVHHPMRYAELLAEQMKKHGAKAWLVNTGWTGGSFGKGSRMKLKYTRAIIDAINRQELADAPTQADPFFRVGVVTSCPGVPEDVLVPKNTWEDPEKFDEVAKKLVRLFNKNFEQYADEAGPEVLEAAPKVD